MSGLIVTRHWLKSWVSDEDDDDEPASPDDLLQRFIDDDFDPGELDPNYKK